MIWRGRRRRATLYPRHSLGQSRFRDPLSSRPGWGMIFMHNTGVNQHGEPVGLRSPDSRLRKNALMRSLVVALTVMTLAPAPPADGPAPFQAQADVRGGGSRSPAAVIDSDGRVDRARDRTNCRTVKLTEWRNGAKVSRRERRCER